MCCEEAFGPFEAFGFGRLRGEAVETESGRVRLGVGELGGRLGRGYLWSSSGTGRVVGGVWWGKRLSGWGVDAVLFGVGLSGAVIVGCCGVNGVDLRL